MASCIVYVTKKKSEFSKRMVELICDKFSSFIEISVLPYSRSEKINNEVKVADYLIFLIGKNKNSELFLEIGYFIGALGKNKVYVISPYPTTFTSSYIKHFSCNKSDNVTQIQSLVERLKNEIISDLAISIADNPKTITPHFPKIHTNNPTFLLGDRKKNIIVEVN